MQRVITFLLIGLLLVPCLTGAEEIKLTKTETDSSWAVRWKHVGAAGKDLQMFKRHYYQGFGLATLGFLSSLITSKDPIGRRVTLSICLVGFAQQLYSFYFAGRAGKWLQKAANQQKGSAPMLRD